MTSPALVAVANSRTPPGSTRRATLHGREYIVAPATLIMPGVLDGSDGPILYTAEEFSRDPAIWNGTPLVVRHPSINGRPVSARDPEILDAAGIGFAFRSGYEGKLASELWFDVERTKKVDYRILDRLNRNESIELSTGLFLNKEPAPANAVFNAPPLGSPPRPYSFIARNPRPDHIAILPDEVGACSILDGCGVLNKDGKDAMSSWLKGMWKWLTLQGYGDAPVANAISHDELRDQLCRLVEKTYSPNRSATEGMYGFDPMTPYVVQVFDRNFIYARGDKLFKHGYMTDNRTNAVSLSDSAPVEVRRVTSYKPVMNADGSPVAPFRAPDGSAIEQIEESSYEVVENASDTSTPNSTDHDNRTGDTSMDRKATIAFITANCDCWKGGEAELDKMSDDRLMKVKAGIDGIAQKEAVANAAKKGFTDAGGNEFVWNESSLKWETKPKPAPAPTPTANAGTPPKPQTTAEWLATAPPEVQRVVQNSIEAEKRERESLVQHILTANHVPEASRPAVQAAYAGMPVEQLRVVAGALPVQQGYGASFPGQQSAPLVNYGGASVPSFAPQPQALGDGDVLPLPTNNWGQDDSDSRKQA